MRAGVRINLRMRFTCTVYRLADAVDPQHANVLVDAADCARATGLQSIGHAKPKPTAHSLNGSHSFNGSGRRATAAHSTGGSHARRRSSATAPGSVGSSGAEGDGDHQPHSSSRSAKREKGGRHHKQHHHHSHYHSQASIATTPGASIAPMAPMAPMALSLSPEPSLSPERRANGDHLESEWDDVPCAYQQRVRKVWTRDSTFQVMNEVVVDRGPSPYLAQIELYGDGNHLTTVEADGLCLATPTGSTAYSLAAGGSLVHPEIPAILVTPICAHTLSFRPMLLPDSMVVRVVLPPDSRNTAWASFDGRHRIELRRGDHIQITASKYPLPTVCASQSQTQDWMSSLSRCLNWNERKRQKKFGGDVAASATSDDDNDNKGDDEDNNDDRGDGDDDEDEDDDGMLSF
ncbi:hypothetical protein GGF44_002636 [Coemansia sp. RSA 1694]|nr:hypothetical protein GGF44_002636 [Coemansia sp. RSA 1694]